MALVSTVKEVFFPATIPSTLSSELVSGPWAGRWNLGPIIGTTLVGLDWGSGEKWGFPQSRQGIPADTPSSSVPIGHRLGMLLAGRGCGHAFARCPELVASEAGSGDGGS